MYLLIGNALFAPKRFFGLVRADKYPHPGMQNAPSGVREGAFAAGCYGVGCYGVGAVTETERVTVAALPQPSVVVSDTV
jgi:hypothetical protein